MSDPTHELTQAQVRALEAQQPAPLQLVNPITQEVFVLIRKDIYDLTCAIVGGGRGQVWDDEADDDLIAPANTARKSS